jgi:hypothetical protein
MTHWTQPVEMLKVLVVTLKARGLLEAGSPKGSLGQCNRATVQKPREPMCAYWGLPAISASCWRWPCG